MATLHAMIGHSDPKMTALYSGIDYERKAKAVTAFEAALAADKQVRMNVLVVPRLYLHARNDRKGCTSGPGKKHESPGMTEAFEAWGVQDLNLRLPPCEGGTLPLS